jgi:hypothetical protein
MTARSPLARLFIGNVARLGLIALGMAGFLVLADARADDAARWQSQATVIIR